jgi:hypothetical protein
MVCTGGGAATGGGTGTTWTTTDCSKAAVLAQLNLAADGDTVAISAGTDLWTSQLWNASRTGGQGNLYLCTAPDTWTLSYTPYMYPHPLAS